MIDQDKKASSGWHDPNNYIGFGLWFIINSVSVQFGVAAGLSNFAEALPVIFNINGMLSFALLVCPTAFGHETPCALRVLGMWCGGTFAATMIAKLVITL